MMHKRPILNLSSIFLLQISGYQRIFKLTVVSILLFAIFISSCKKDEFTGEVVGLCPTVISDPADKAVDVILDKVVTLTFNTPMQASTINNNTFTIKQNGNLIAGSISPTTNSAVFTFTPTSPLNPFLVYEGRVTTAARDTLRTALEADYVWTFTSVPNISVTANPVGGGTVSGSGNFEQGSSTTVVATALPGSVFTNWTEEGTIVSNSTSYTFTVNGNRALVANFITIPVGALAVNLSSSPAIGGNTSGAGAYPVGSSVTVTAIPNANYTFLNWTDNNVVVSTSRNYQFTLVSNRILVANFRIIPASQFALNLSSSPIAGGSTNGEGAYNSGTNVIAVATPNNGYSFINWTENGASVSTNPNYSFTINGNRTLIANFLFVSTAGIGPNLPSLGLAGNYAILTQSGISTTGVTSITGNLGVSPITATAITGFGLILDGSGQFATTPTVNGRVFASNYAAPTPANLTVAVDNMQTAYTNSNNLTAPAPVLNLGAGNLSGLVIAPGLYKFSTGVLISNQGVTLVGNANDTWVFTVAQDLTVNNMAKITLGPGVQAKNIYWVVAGQATLGTGVDFSGIILSKTLISLNTGAKVNGRLLAQTAVTLNASTVIQP
jgi:hypothetical protein